MSRSRVRLALLLVGLLFVAAVLAPVIRPGPDRPWELEQGHSAAPSAHHPFGTDEVGRDVLSRVLHGARISFSIALVSMLMSLSLGTAVGMAAGYAGGAIDTLLMRVVDVALAVPRVFLLVVVIALWQGDGITETALILILGLTSWFDVSRQVRAQVLSVKNREFIAASRALGLNPARIAIRHILPSVRAPILVAGVLGMANMVLIEAGLSFLGLGVGPPTASLGNMISDGQRDLTTAPWIAVMPALFVTVTVLAFSVIGEGLRETTEAVTSAP